MRHKLILAKEKITQRFVARDEWLFVLQHVVCDFCYLGYLRVEWVLRVAEKLQTVNLVKIFVEFYSTELNDLWLLI